jgi:hypothetical protein
MFLILFYSSDSRNLAGFLAFRVRRAGAESSFGCSVSIGFSTGASGRVSTGAAAG